MYEWIKNVWFLSIKEFKSVTSDITLMGLVVAVFTVAVYSVSTGLTTEVKNASVALIDQDQSALSYQIRDAILPPYFKPALLIQAHERDEKLDKGEFVFIIDIPPNFAHDVLAEKRPQVYIWADATAATLAGVGSAYLEQIVQREVQAYLRSSSNLDWTPLEPVVSIMYNPNGTNVWFIGVMQVVSNVTLLTMILVGAAIIREREHGTMEHLLVMPVRASEIAIAKIITNSALIMGAALLSLGGVVHLLLGVPIIGSVSLFTLGLAIYLFTVSSLGVWLATLAPTMPQFGLLCIPIYIVTRLLSGGETPMESMSQTVQDITFFSPVTQFVMYAQSVLFRNADLAIVWPQLAILSVAGVLFLAMALSRFRQMLAKQG